MSTIHITQTHNSLKPQTLPHPLSLADTHTFSSIGNLAKYVQQHQRNLVPFPSHLIISRQIFILPVRWFALVSCVCALYLYFIVALKIYM